MLHGHPNVNEGLNSGLSRASSLDTTRRNVVEKQLRHKPKGRHPQQRLTAVKVKALKAPGRYADGQGLYLFVDRNGAKRWIWRGVVKGRRRDIGVGPIALVSLADARAEAVRLKTLAWKDVDPLAERRRERRGTLTFRDAAKEVHKSHAASFRNAKHRTQWLSSLEAYVFPVFAEHTVDAVDSADILKALTPIWTTKPETARRVKQRIKVVMDWAKASGYRNGENPVDVIASVLPRHKTEQAHHPALPYAALPAFLRQLRAADAGLSARLAFEFLILTATRTVETRKAQWEELDLDKRTWTIPGVRMKTGREHRVPLSVRCVEILSEAQTLADGGPFVFAGRSPKTPLSDMVFLMLLRRMKRGDITGHGFRSTFRVWAGEKTTFAHAVVEAALAHVVKNKTEAAYFRTDLFDQRRKLMETWAKYATAAPGKVVALTA